MAQIVTRNPLVFPCGVRARYEATHYAVSGKLYVCGIAAGPTSKNFINLLNGGKSQNSGGQIGDVIDRYVGPAHRTGTFNSQLFSGLPTSGVVPSNGTMACIYNPDDSLASSPRIVNTAGASAGVELQIDSAGLSYIVWPASQPPFNTVCNYTMNVNDPYFVGCSWNSAGKTVHCAMNLRTGQLSLDDTQAGVTGSIHADTGIFQIGCDGSPGGTTSPIGCVMYQSGYINGPTFKRWATDPWSFWYPHV